MPAFIAPRLSGGIDFGKFIDRAFTVSCDASQEEQALIGAAPGFLGGILNMFVPGVGSAVSQAGSGLLHESECTANRRREAAAAEAARQKALAEQQAKTYTTALIAGAAALAIVLIVSS